MPWAKPVPFCGWLVPRKRAGRRRILEIPPGFIPTCTSTSAGRYRVFFLKEGVVCFRRLVYQDSAWRATRYHHTTPFPVVIDSLYGSCSMCYAHLAWPHSFDHDDLLCLLQHAGAREAPSDQSTI